MFHVRQDFGQGLQHKGMFQYLSTGKQNACMLTAELTISQNVNINTATGKLRLAAIPAQRIFNGFNLS